MDLPERWAFPVTALLVIAIASAIFWDFLTFQKVLLYKDIGSDTLNGAYPQLMQAARSLNETGLPGWSFHHGLGQGIFPAGLENPFNWILYSLGPEKLAYGLGWVEWSKLLIAGLFFNAYLRCLDLSPWARSIGTLLLTFSGLFLLGTTWWAYSYTIVLVALALWSIERYLSKGKWGMIPLATALFAGANYWFYGLFFVTYVLVRLAEQRQSLRDPLHRATVLAGLALLGVLISSAWFLPIAMQMIDAPRVSGDSSLTRQLFAYPIFQLEEGRHYWTAVYRAFSNNLLGTGSSFSGWGNYLEAPAFYGGLLSLLLLPQVFAQPDKPRAIYMIWLGLWVFAVVFPWFRYALSLFSGDYYRTGLSFYFAFTVTYLAIRALDSICRQSQLSVWLLILTLTGLLSLLFWPSAEPQPGFGPSAFLGILLVAQAALLFLVSRSTRPGVWLAALLAVICLELGYQAYAGVNHRDVVSSEQFETSGYNDATLAALDTLKQQDEGFYRIEKTYSSSPAMHFGINDALVQDYYSSPSYSSFNHGNYIRFLAAVDLLDPAVEASTRWAKGVTSRPLLQGLLGTKYLLVRNSSGSMQTHVPKEIFTQVEEFDSVTLYQNQAYVPFGATYDSFMLRSDFDRLPVNMRTLAMVRAAVIEDADSGGLQGMSQLDVPTEPSQRAPDLEGYLALTRGLAEDRSFVNRDFSADQISGNFSSPEKRILFLPMPLDSGWKATVDGEPRQLIMLHGGLTGLVLEPGDRRVVLGYRTPTLLIGMLGSGTGILLYLVLVMRSKPGAKTARPESELNGETNQAQR